MRKQTAFAVLFLLLFGGQTVADDLDERMKKACSAIDDMALILANQRTTEESEFYSKIVKMQLEKAIPESVVQARAVPGESFIMVFTMQWTYYTHVRDGKVLDHKLNMN